MSKSREKIKEFSRLTPQGLRNSLKEKKERLRELRFDLVAGKVRNVREVREIKKDIAKIETILNF